MHLEEFREKYVNFLRSKPSIQVDLFPVYKNVKCGAKGDEREPSINRYFMQTCIASV